MQQQIAQILAEVTQMPTLAETLSASSDIVNEVGLDSLQLMQFMLLVEQRLELTIDYDHFEFKHLSSIAAFCMFLETQR